MDGPYGAPSSYIFQAQHAVLIATGIGVTPFASILQSIMHRYWKARHACPKCKFSWASEIPPTVMHLRKVTIYLIFPTFVSYNKYNFMIYNYMKLYRYHKFDVF